MARLNVDYKLERNRPTFRALTRKLQSEGEAWEHLLRFRDIAQDWFAGKMGAPARSGIPYAAFEREGDLEVMVEVGYAFRDDQGDVHAVDEVPLFGWLLGVSKGGKTRGEQSRNADGTYAGPEQDDSSSTAGAGHQPTTSPAGSGAGAELELGSSCDPGSSSLLLSISLLKHSPKTPQISGATRASRRDQCNAAFAEVKLHVLAVYDGYSTGKADAKFLDQAWERLTPLARQLVLSSYESWLVCCREFWGARRQNRDGTFLRDLKASFRANLSRALTAVGCRDGPEPDDAHQDRDETPSAGDLSATEGDFDAEAFDEGGGA